MIQHLYIAELPCDDKQKRKRKMHSEMNSFEKYVSERMHTLEKCMQVSFSQWETDYKMHLMEKCTQKYI